jgi:hypothetical protein
MPANLGQKGLTKVVKICVKIIPSLFQRGQMDVKRGNMVLKQGPIGVKEVLKWCWPALACMGPPFSGLWLRTLEVGERAEARH